jgi:hypothetical protein
MPAERWGLHAENTPELTLRCDRLAEFGFLG